MAIDIEHVEASIRRFHKTTNVLAAKATGVSEENLLMYPVIVCDGSKIYAATFSTQRKPDSDFYTPYIVNGSFCLEMLLKIIIYYEQEVWIKGHNLLRLFEQISEPNKNYINVEFSKLVKDAAGLDEVSKFVMNEVGIKIEWNLASVLAMSSDAFENWRYAFDLGKNKSCFLGYEQAYGALSNVKCRLSANK